ncbi:hypothetical protein CK203_032679 [Vitis vinifera]|uniref:Uncharacterized protein n=1 Tax=Vitis vinifera TaxID=29760 RepID=A0A438HXS3_VITVI|nr:hypothetical protein CK203_032679 [Vitis vinifera]
MRSQICLGIEERKGISFEISLELMGLYKTGVLCLGGDLRKIVTLDSLKRRGWTLANFYYLCKDGEELAD